MQHRLRDLGFRPGEVDGRYGDATYAAVMAFQKHEGLDPDGHAGPITMAALEAGLTAPGPRVARHRVSRSTSIGRSRSSSPAMDDAASSTFRAATGSDTPGRRAALAIADTPTGTYDIERRIDGVRVAPLGKLYRPLYFKGGFAIHGSSNVPGYPASHGCVRTTNADQDYVWEHVGERHPVEIYDA